MSWRREIDVAGVPVEARHVPELIVRLRRAGHPYVANKVERALSVRTVHVPFGTAEREAIVAVADGPPQFSELYRVLLREVQRRRSEGR